MSLDEDLQMTLEDTMRGLKDFQRATVERVAYLSENGQNRVLVADEVGLGKTLVARGVIAEMANIRYREKDDFFKIVYVCSNQSIARQNLAKLDLFGAEAEDIADTRLSMQHLRLAEQEAQAKDNNQYVQMIPLTPGTSFQMTNGGGSVQERALLFAVLNRVPELAGFEAQLEALLIYGAEKVWSREKEAYEKRVAGKGSNLSENSSYPYDLFPKIREYDREHRTLQELTEHLEHRKAGTDSPYRDRVIIGKLRIMFAHISVDRLDPDLVIMDEFQRYRFLIQQEEAQTEAGILAQRFLHDDNSGRTRVLLLSATPYKLYSTLEEIEENNNVDEHFSEFRDVMHFLLPAGEGEKFDEIWTDFSVSLQEMKAGDTSVLAVKKEKAEDAMYRAVCRTERVSVMDNGDFTDDESVKTPVKISENDIRSYIDAEKLLEDTGARFSLPVDYVKSCPYLLSFMHNYKVKEQIEKYFKQHPGEVKKAKKNSLWLDGNKIRNYEKLPAANARLEELQKRIFQNRSELYLWVPPSRPYYEMAGVYRHGEGFSKILVFSAWEMVPRMIGGLISYEAERRTVGALGKCAKNVDRKNLQYFAESDRRYPYQRLTFRDRDNQPASMALLCLLYPSRTLADLYDPIACMNRKMSLAEIEAMLSEKLERLLEQLDIYVGSPSTGGRDRVDERWYYLAPVLMDGDDARSWIEENLHSADKEEGPPEEKGSRSFRHHLERLKELTDASSLGRPPDDLIPTLVNMVLGSPAVCIYRSNGNDAKRATELARVFMNRFNQPESTAIVELAYENDNVRGHWQKVLRYCKDGNFQAMFDEYAHMLAEDAGMSRSAEKVNREVHTCMMDALKFQTASYDFDTYPGFRDRMQQESSDERPGRRRELRLRSHFAAGFVKGEGSEEKSVQRRDSVRNAFNSPMRPFVLATTSIGQEGLDFHYYCRKVMHWNLPSNPVDLEQREGRVNRFKCLAIRQNIAEQYGGMEFHRDVWAEMFAAAENAKQGTGQSDLVPYWCLGKDQNVKIERIVPMYPVSKDEVTYERLIKILSLYRLTMGQPRQEELLEYMFQEFDNGEDLKPLLINLCPFLKQNSTSEN